MQKAQILGIDVDCLTMEQAVEKATNYIQQKTCALIATANAEMIMRATKDRELFDILHAADMVVPDGAGTVWAARTLGYTMPERIAGYDLTQELLAIAPKYGWRIYFFGSAPGVAETAKKKAEELYPNIHICGVHNGFFSPSDTDNIIEEIRQAKPDILLAALGVPKQEKWLYTYKDKLTVPLSIGVGGTLDVMAGVMKRAPLWMQKAKLEWLFRGLLQPKRIFRLLALPHFVWKVLQSKSS